MFGSLDISTSALVAQRTRMDVIAGNIANAYSTQRLDGQPGPYKRRFAVFAAGNPAGASPSAPGVHVEAVEEDPAPGRLVYDPQHPDAIRTGPRAGYVEYPNVDLATEMVDAIEAARAYEANITAMDVTKSMISASLRLLA
ncbi:MAG TPA: flagellar basal body rod protein FlgC [Phycisphaerae bacterium]|nr:flagellar basal body rod protein FlgC [Phycisphaerae bacterium]